MTDIVGIGIDVESVAAFRNKKLSSRFFARVFSKEEIEYCRRFRDPAPRFAARFCAKEALVKAVGGHVRMLVWDCEVRNRASGAPEIRVRGNRPLLKKFLARHQVFVSLSHSEEMAVAFVVLVRKRKAT
jgi:holo-[acyl-carrier protein] synthase